MSFGKPFLSIKDEFMQIRAEWILGYSSLNTNPALGNKMNKFGLCQALSIHQDVYAYLSPLGEKKGYKMTQSLLSLLWNNKGKADLFNMNCITSFLQIVLEN